MILMMMMMMMMTMMMSMIIAIMMTMMMTLKILKFSCREIQSNFSGLEEEAQYELRLRAMNR